jgi:hypothetical protein
MTRKTAVLIASSVLAVALIHAAPSEAAAVTCAVGGGNAPTGWSLFGVGGGVAAGAAPFISPSGSATDCYIMTDTSSGATETGPWPGTTTTGFYFAGIPGIPNIPSDPTTGLGTTNGSAMVSPAFTANAGQVLKFDFAFISNDGTQTFSDWAAAFLQPVDAGGNPVGPSLNLFTARTSDNSQVVPGFGFTAFPSGLALTPSTAFLQGDTFCLNGLTGGTACDGVATQFGPVRYPFSPGSPGDPGGSTPWIGATFNFDGSTAGTYELIMAAGNVGDEIYSSGLLFAGSSITGGSPAEDPEDVPEPASLPMLGAGLLALGFVSWRRKGA